MPSIIATALGAILLPLLAAPHVALASGPLPAGTVVLARPAGNALLIWDASDDVAAIVANKTSDADASAQLEYDASRILARALTKIDRDATSITVRIIYNKTGAVSPIYGTATFAGVERYATLTMSAKDAKTDRDKWRELSPGSAIPPWFAFSIIGELPQR